MSGEEVRGVIAVVVCLPLAFWAAFSDPGKPPRYIRREYGDRWWWIP